MDIENNYFFKKFGPAHYYDMAFSMLGDARQGPGLQPNSYTHQLLQEQGFFDVPAVRAWVAGLSRPATLVVESAASPRVGRAAREEAKQEVFARRPLSAAFLAALAAVRDCFGGSRSAPAARGPKGMPRPFLAAVNGRRTRVGRRLTP